MRVMALRTSSGDITWARGTKTPPRGGAKKRSRSANNKAFLSVPASQDQLHGQKIMLAVVYESEWHREGVSPPHSPARENGVIGVPSHSEHWESVPNAYKANVTKSSALFGTDLRSDGRQNAIDEAA